MISDLARIKQIVSSIKANPAQIKCPATNRDAVAILLRAKAGQQSIFCVKCMVEKSEELARVKKDLVPLEDFLINVEDQINLLENKKDTISEKEAIEFLDRVMQRLKEQVMLQIESTYDKSITEVTAELKTYIGLVTSGAVKDESEKMEVAKALEETPSTIPEQLSDAVQFYNVNMIDRKMLLKESLKEAMEAEVNKQILDQFTLHLERLLKTVASSLLFENKFFRKFNPETDIIRRLTNIQPFYQYAMNGNLSLSFKVDHPSIFYGFSNYQATDNFRVKYTISEGESKNLNNVLLEFESNLRTANNSHVLSQQQSASTSAELFASPLVLEPEIWYNISMNPIEQRNITMYWATATNQQGTLDQGFRLNSGKEVRFKGGLDDNCGNSSYAHIYADFYIV